MDDGYCGNSGYPIIVLKKFLTTGGLYKILEFFFMIMFSLNSLLEEDTVVELSVFELEDEFGDYSRSCEMPWAVGTCTYCDKCLEFLFPHIRFGE